jgi:hypothetical protein
MSPKMAVLAEARGSGEGAAAASLRTLGVIAVLVVGAVHLEQYFAVNIHAVRIIGPLFALNFAGAMLIGAGLLILLHGCGPYISCSLSAASAWRKRRSSFCSSASTSRSSASRNTAIGQRSSSRWPRKPLPWSRSWRISGSASVF